MAHSRPSAAFAFIGANLLPMTGSPGALPDRTIVVRDGVIVAVGPSAELEAPADAVRIEARGKTVMPGLCDMHAHIVPIGPDADTGLTEAEALVRAKGYLLVFLAGGVTTVRNMAGTPFHLQLRDAVREGRFLSPWIHTAGPVLETTYTFPELAAFGRLVRTPAEARAAVLEQKREGYDFIKVYNNIDSDIYDEIVRTAREVGLPVIGHVAFSKGLEGALAARQDSIEHLRSYDFAVDVRGPEAPKERWAGWLHTTAARIAEVADRTAEAGVWNVPTLAIEANLPTDAELAEGDRPGPDLAGLPAWLADEVANDTMYTLFSGPQRQAIRNGLGARFEMVKALDKTGAKLMAGTDCPGCQLAPGRSLVRELELYVQAGLSPYRTLQTATVEAARFLGDDAGTVEVGKRADLLLLDGDPLQDLHCLKAPAGVMLGGRWLPKALIDSQLAGL